MSLSAVMTACRSLSPRPCDNTGASVAARRSVRSVWAAVHVGPLCGSCDAAAGRPLYCYGILYDEWAHLKNRGGLLPQERSPGPRTDPDRAGDAGIGDGGHVQLPLFPLSA